MYQEKLKAAFCFIRVWRGLAYTFLIIGCFLTLCWGLHTLTGALTAFYSQWDAKNDACQQQEKFEAKCTNDIHQAQQEFAAYAAALPQRLQNIKENYQRELQQFHQAVQQYSQAVHPLTNRYNESATLTESELKKLKNLPTGSISPLTIPVQDLNSTADYLSFKNTVHEKGHLLDAYKQQVVGVLIHQYEEYAAPVLAELNKAQRKVDELQSLLNDVRQDYERKIAALEAQKREIPVPTYAARPEKNIYGTTDIKTLSEVLDASDYLPLISARLGAATPLTEHARRNLRMSILNMTDWLPVYTRTYAPTRAEIEGVQKHNADIDSLISDLRQEMYKKLQLIRNELQVKQGILNMYERRMAELNEQKSRLSDRAYATTQNWDISHQYSQLKQQLDKNFPAEPTELESQLQREKDLVPLKEKEMKELVQQLQQRITESQQELESTLAELSAQERKACVAAILQPSPFGFICGQCADIMDNSSSMINNALSTCNGMGKGHRILSYASKTISPMLQKLVPFATAGKACATALRSIPFGAIVFVCLLVGSWLGFSLLLIAGDYLICPLINATKVQEIALNTRKKEND